MSDNPPVHEEMFPEISSPIFKAMREIASATSPDEIVDSLQQHVLRDFDYIGLIQIGFGSAGEPVSEIVSMRSRGEAAPRAEFANMVRQAAGQHQIIVPDIAQLDDSSPLKAGTKEALQAASLAIFPLAGRDRTVGYLVLANHDPHPYSESEIKSLDGLAGQMAVVMENLSLLEALSHQTGRLSLVNDLAQAITGVFDLGILGDLLAPSLAQALPLAHLSLALTDAEQPPLRIKTLYGPEIPQEAVQEGTYVHRALEKGLTTHIDDLYTGDGRDGNLWMVNGIHTLIIVPLIARKQPLGTLNIGGERASCFQHADVMMVEQVAAQVAVTLENIRLFDRLQASLEETTTLYSIALAMNAAQSLEEVYDTALTEMAYLCQADRLTLYLAGPDPRTDLRYLETGAVFENGQVTTDMESTRYASTEVPILSQFPQSRANLVFNDVQTDQRLDDDLRAEYTRRGVNALMMIPLSTGVIWLGALLIEAHQGQTFTGEQARLCRNMADQAALVIDSHLLLKLTRQAALREQALRETIERIRDADSAEKVLHIAAEELSEVFDMPAEQLKITEGYPAPPEDKTLSTAEQELIEDVADQVALAIENIKLVEATKKRTLREQIVSDITARLQHTASVDDVLETAVRTLHTMLDDCDVTLRLAPQIRSAAHRPAPDSQDDGVDDAEAAQEAAQ